MCIWLLLHWNKYTVVYWINLSGKTENLILRYLDRLLLDKTSRITNTAPKNLVSRLTGSQRCTMSFVHSWKPLHYFNFLRQIRHKSWTSPKRNEMLCRSLSFNWIRYCGDAVRADCSETNCDVQNMTTSSSLVQSAAQKREPSRPTYLSVPYSSSVSLIFFFFVFLNEWKSSKGEQMKRTEITTFNLCIYNEFSEKSLLVWRILEFRGRKIYGVKIFFYKSDVWLTVHRNSVWIRKTN